MTDAQKALAQVREALAKVEAERDKLRDVLLRGGFVSCDIPACSCGSWHHRYGLPERMRDIEDTLAEAGHELSNANGNLPINALKALVTERDELRAALNTCVWVLRQPLDGRKGECERKALDAVNAVLRREK